MQLYLFSWRYWAIEIRCPTVGGDCVHDCAQDFWKKKYNKRKTGTLVCQLQSNDSIDKNYRAQEENIKKTGG